MIVSFPAYTSLEESKDPVLGAILSECEIEAQITVECDMHETGADLGGVEVDDISFNPPDAPEALKAMFLMNEGLMATIKSEVAAKVDRDWLEFIPLAYEWHQACLDEAAERRFEENRERDDD